jgi:hypothetical protein
VASRFRRFRKTTAAPSLDSEGSLDSLAALGSLVGSRDASSPPLALRAAGGMAGDPGGLTADADDSGGD